MFLVFEFLILCALLRAVRDRSDLSPIGVGLTVGIINLMFCAWFGNVFAYSYATPVVMISVACLIAYERLAHLTPRPVRGRGVVLLATCGCPACKARPNERDTSPLLTGKP